uniref:Phosphatidate cytidylyltransferase n=1 Tax=wastewater metagenome TaxID=527639 RepID=A0A0A8KWQ5_9ZZZZ
MLKRSLIAIPALLLLASVIYIHGLYAKIVVLVVHLICVHEFLGAIAAIAAPLRGLSYGFAGSLFLVYAFLGGQSLVSGLLAISLMLVFLVLMICQRKVTDGLYTAFTMLYPGILFASIYDILSIPNIQISRFLLILAFGCAIVTDTFAYLGGSLLGRHKLIERISPHKTVEGALCGLVFGIVFTFLFGSHFQSLFGIQLNPSLYTAWGALLSLFAQIGDLSESYLKRWFGIKDFGKVWGPHGGMLDRLDSMLFIAPIASIFSMFLM